MASIYERECRQISNRFYNIALDRALSRDLYGATILLKKALKFNSKNINARNLLSLIDSTLYFPFGMSKLSI